MMLFYLLLINAAVASSSERRLPDQFFTKGDLEYRDLVLDAGTASLYVGGKGRIFRLWAYNINDTAGTLYAEKKLELPESELSECRAAGSTNSECQPSTRFMMLQDQKESLYVCSSVAMKPEIRLLDASTLKDRREPRTEIGICSPDNSVNATAVVVEWGNPKEFPTVYSGIRTGMAGENHLIYRVPVVEGGVEVQTSMRTIYNDNRWLNEPQFVGSFDIGEYVYFFFREIALESGTTERVVRSRVARVCKKDVGGKTLLRKVWTSFVKARLNCSISAQYPYYFDHLQSITKVETADDTLFYASMSTSETAFVSSSICVFTLKSINQIFNHGAFLESAGSIWNTLPDEAISGQQRPGTCVPNSQTLTESELLFAQHHLMMADPVSGTPPIMPTRDVVFTNIMVDVKGEQNVVVAIDGRTSTVWKISHWKAGSEWKWKLLEKKDIETFGSIRAAVLLPGEFYYTATPKGVTQFSLAACANYQSCTLCAIDPYCSWSISRESCHPREKVHATSVGWVLSWAGREAAECVSVMRPKQVKAYPSDSVHFKGVDGCSWLKDGSRLFFGTNAIITKSDDLLLTDVSKVDNGDYECVVDERTIVKYRLHVDHEDCAMPKTVEAYKSCWLNHCKRRQERDFALKTWTEQKNRIIQCQINESHSINRID